MNAPLHPKLLWRSWNRRFHIRGSNFAVALFVLLAVVTGVRAKGTSTNRVCLPTAHGSLMVYSATDEFNDGDVLYYAHSAYAVYSYDGKLFETVGNHISRSDEIPELVTLPVGRYVIEARSDHEGYVRRAVVIHAGQITVLDLE